MIYAWVNNYLFYGKNENTDFSFLFLYRMEALLLVGWQKNNLAN